MATDKNPMQPFTRPPKDCPTPLRLVPRGVRFFTREGILCEARDNGYFTELADVGGTGKTINPNSISFFSFSDGFAPNADVIVFPIIQPYLVHDVSWVPETTPSDPAPRKEQAFSPSAALLKALNEVARCVADTFQGRQVEGLSVHLDDGSTVVGAPHRRRAETDEDEDPTPPAA